MYKQLIQLQSNKPKNPREKRAEDLDRHFSKEDMQTASRRVKGHSASIITEERKIKSNQNGYH